jgi:cell division septation protein DedD
MKMGIYIGALLYQHDCVVIPGFGGFIANYAPATINPVQHTFMPPSRQIMFNASLHHNDGLLATYIAKKEGIGYDRAITIIAKEVVVIQEELHSSKTILLEGLGALRLNQEHAIVFTPKLAYNYLEEAYGLSPFVSPAIRRNGYQYSQDKKDNKGAIHLPIAVRRIAAIAVPLIAIGLWSLFNQDRISKFTSNYSSVFPSEIISNFSSSIRNSIPVYVLSHSKSTLNIPQTLPKAEKEVSSKVTTSDDIPKAEVKIEEPVLNTTVSQTPANEITSNASGHFLIISGAFKVKENADKLLKQLKAKNFDATLVGQNKKGLYLVSAASCVDADQATLKLKEVLDKGIEAAWILKK